MKRDELPIASPCQADFASMSPVAALREKGRFCGDCKKVVHDLSKMTAREARSLLAAPKTEGLCVRYLYDAAGEIVFQRELGIVPASELSRFARMARGAKIAVAVALPLSLTACMGAAPNRPPQNPEPVMGEISAPVTPDGGGAVEPGTEVAPATSGSAVTPSTDAPVAK